PPLPVRLCSSRLGRCHKMTQDYPLWGTSLVQRPFPLDDNALIYLIYQYKITDIGLHSDSVDWHSPCNS
ncbi:hypothetical protein ACLKQF_24135, partial [Aeromonas salmonicida]